MNNFMKSVALGVIIAIVLSFIHWSGIIIGSILAGYLLLDYRKTSIVGLIIGALTYPFIFAINVLIYGKYALRAYGLTGMLPILAIFIGLILAILGALTGTALNRVILDLKGEKKEEQ